ncbi:NAD-binding protein, partial [Candidatus Woesearchaeota archaeon]|nr:NAD-binding protein [Candidatus Woesearchaeota archaeon]
DYNPETIMNLAKEGIDCKYGDANDLELLNELNFSKAKMVISTIPDFDTNLLIINRTRVSNKKTVIIVLSHDIDNAVELYDRGATYVITPHFLGGHHAATLIEKHGLNINKFLKEKVNHIESLKNRNKRGHRHPRHEKH